VIGVTAILFSFGRTFFTVDFVYVKTAQHNIHSHNSNSTSGGGVGGGGGSGGGRNLILYNEQSQHAG
jgi:uncharacterized membrane protein